MKFFYVVYKIYFGVIFFGLLLIGYPILRLIDLFTKGYTPIYKTKRFMSFVLQGLTLNFLWVKSKHTLPKGPCIVCSNHASYLDITLMISLMEKPIVFMGKGELMNWPFFGFFFTDMHIPVFRGSPVKAARSLEIAKQRISEGISIVIFPEGTIPKSYPEMGKFKDGLFRLALETQVPIVPVSFPDNYKHMADLEYTWEPGRPGINRAYIQPYIVTQGLTKEYLKPLKEQTRAAIQRNLYGDT